MHGNQWVLKIAVLKYYSVSKRGTTAKSNPKQATDPISLHTKFGDNSSNTFPLNERKPCVTPDIGRRTPDIGHRTSDNGHRTSDIGHRTAKKAKIIYPPPRGVDIITTRLKMLCFCGCACRTITRTRKKSLKILQKAHHTFNVLNVINISCTHFDNLWHLLNQTCPVFIKFPPWRAESST